MSEPLGTHTEAGRAVKAVETRLIRWKAQVWKCEVLIPKSDTCSIDAIFHRDDIPLAVAEIKCRDITREQLVEYGTYLITESKLGCGMAYAYELGVPYLLIVLLNDGWSYQWKICEADGRPLFEWKTEQTLTQRTIAGGAIYRDNAFLPLEEAACSQLSQFTWTPATP